MDNKKEMPAIVLNLGAVEIPQYQEQKIGGRKYVNHGQNNLYPNYLLDKFTRSPKHGAIVKGKVKYIIGKGFEFKDAQSQKLKDRLKRMNRYNESLTALGRKAVTDLELYGGFYLQVIWSKGGELADVIHLDYHKMRSNEDNSLFFFKKDWSKGGEIKEYAAFNPEKRQGTQVYFYKEYSPGADVYTCPDYTQALTYIEADILVSEHVLNNAKGGFTGSKAITFTDGEPETQEEIDAIENALNKKFTGSGGSKLVISFVDKPELAPKIEDLGASDLTKEDFTRVDNLISQNIFSSHSVTSPALFGIKTEGQLGASNELRNAYDIFRNTYANNKQEAVEEAFNLILTTVGLPEVKINPVSPINYSLDELKGVAPQAYILKEILGINSEEWQPDPKPETPPQDQEGEGVAMGLKKEDQELLNLFAEYGKPRASYISIKSRRLRFSEGDDLDAALLLFDLTQTEQKVIEILRKDARATAEVISEALDISVKSAGGILTDLEERGLLASKTEKVGGDEQTVRELTKEGKQAIADRKQLKNKLKIMYAYQGPQDDRNRPFCAKLMELDRYYTRADIETISQRVGYSVWERRGGFYHNPQTGVTTPYCRHTWEQNLLIEKSK